MATADYRDGRLRDVCLREFLFGDLWLPVGKITAWKNILVETAGKTSRGLTAGTFENLNQFPNVERLFANHAWILGTLSGEEQSRFRLLVPNVVFDMELDVPLDFVAIGIFQSGKRRFELFAELGTTAGDEAQAHSTPWGPVPEQAKREVPHRRGRVAVDGRAKLR